MQAKQINWFRNRKSQKRAETAIGIGSDRLGGKGKRHRNQSQSHGGLGHQFNSIRHQAYTTSITFSLVTHELYKHPQLPPYLSLFLSLPLSANLSRIRKKEIKCGRHVATLLLIWQTDAEAEADVDVDADVV